MTQYVINVIYIFDGRNMADATFSLKTKLCLSPWLMFQYVSRLSFAGLYGRVKDV